VREKVGGFEIFVIRIPKSTETRPYLSAVSTGPTESATARAKKAHKTLQKNGIFMIT